MNEYPTDEDLNKVTSYPLKTYEDYRYFAEYIENLWHYCGYYQLKGNTLRLATGGWSGNESIIGAIHRNLYFAHCWCKSERGGLHVYKLPSKSFFK